MDHVLKRLRHDAEGGGEVAYLLYHGGLYFTGVTGGWGQHTTVDTACQILGQLMQLPGIRLGDIIVCDVQTHRGGFAGGPGWFEVDILAVECTPDGCVVHDWEPVAGHAHINDVDERGRPLQGWPGGYDLPGIPPDVLALFREFIL